MDIEKISLKKRKPLTKEQIDALAKKLDEEKNLNPFQIEDTKELTSMYSLNSKYPNALEELFKRYTYLYKNKELILALCIRPAIDYEEVKQNIKDFKKESKRK